MGIPPDPVPQGIASKITSGVTSFDNSTSLLERSAECRGQVDPSTNVIAVHITVIPPKNVISAVRLSIVQMNILPGVPLCQPQVTATIDSTDGNPIPDGYLCQFSFTTTD